MAVVVVVLEVDGCLFVWFCVAVSAYHDSSIISDRMHNPHTWTRYEEEQQWRTTTTTMVMMTMISKALQRDTIPGPRPKVQHTKVQITL